MVMVKPALAYLDIIADLARGLPAAARGLQRLRRVLDGQGRRRTGLVDERAIVRENLLAMRRAGADIIITYHGREALRRAGCERPDAKSAELYRAGLRGDARRGQLAGARLSHRSAAIPLFFERGIGCRFTDEDGNASTSTGAALGSDDPRPRRPRRRRGGRDDRRQRAPASAHPAAARSSSPSSSVGTVPHPRPGALRHLGHRGGHERHPAGPRRPPAATRSSSSPAATTATPTTCWSRPAAAWPPSAPRPRPACPRASPTHRCAAPGRRRGLSTPLRRARRRDRRRDHRSRSGQRRSADPAARVPADAPRPSAHSTAPC